MDYFSVRRFNAMAKNKSKPHHGFGISDESLISPV